MPPQMLMKLAESLYMDPTIDKVAVGELHGRIVWASVAYTTEGPKVLYHMMKETQLSTIRSGCTFFSSFAPEGPETMDQAQERLDRAVKEALSKAKIQEIDKARGEEDVGDEDAEQKDNEEKDTRDDFC